METNIQNVNRAVKLRELKKEAMAIRKKMHWDGRPHSSFQIWPFVADDDEVDANDEDVHYCNYHAAGGGSFVCQNKDVCLPSMDIGDGYSVTNGKRKRDVFAYDAKRVKTD